MFGPGGPGFPGRPWSRRPMAYGTGPYGAGPYGGAAENEAPRILVPPILLQAILDVGDHTREGVLVRAVAFPWIEIVEMMLKDPNCMCDLDARQWEELVAGAWKRAGADEVILTPRSGDGGRDVIATFTGAGRVRLFDQVKRYKPGHLVTA